MLNKDPKDVTKAELLEFLSAQMREGSCLDYKKEAKPSKLVRHVAAMSNTHGGWILVGIDEVGVDHLGRGIPSADFPVGISNEPSMIRDYRNSFLDGITPAVVPQFGLIPLDSDRVEDASKVVLLIRVQESDSAPHELTGSGIVYLRIGDVSHPVKREEEKFTKTARTSDIELLLNRRQKSVELREHIKTRARKRANFSGCDQFSVLCIPCFPSSPPADYNLIRNVAHQARTCPPFQDFGDFQTVTDGLFFEAEGRYMRGQGNLRAALDIGIYGSVLYNASISNSYDPAPIELRSGLCLTVLETVIMTTSVLIDLAEFAGAMQVVMTCSFVERRRGVVYGGEYNGRALPIVDEDLEVGITVPASELCTSQTVSSIWQKFGWAVGFGSRLASQVEPGGIEKGKQTWLRCHHKTFD
ncbi:MAG: ATP-binding protein [Cyanobacteria bacterium]|nr:ATP-binding protein [Cyanobacteriota bacterium]